jgi:hypothetical protein
VSCSRGDNNKASIDVIITNNSNNSVYIGSVKPAAYVIEDGRCIFFLSTPIIFNQKSIIMYGPFDFDIIVETNETRVIKMRMPHEQHDTDNIYRLFYTKEKKIIEDYNVYVDVVKNMSFTIDGYKKGNRIIFEIK